MYIYDEYDQRDRRGTRSKQFRDQTRRYLAGEVSDPEFLPLRLQNGLYVSSVNATHAARRHPPTAWYRPNRCASWPLLPANTTRAIAHFSTRQNVQFNWPALEDVPDILAHLAEVQMHAIQTSGNCIRNTTTDQFAGRGRRRAGRSAPLV